MNKQVVKNGKLVLPKPKKARVTLIIPAALDMNLEIYCMSTGRLKMEVTAEALIRFLKSEGIPDPSVRPVISWRKKET